MLQNNAMISEIGKIADGESDLSLLQKIVVVGTGFEPVLWIFRSFLIAS